MTAEWFGVVEEGHVTARIGEPTGVIVENNGDRPFCNGRVYGCGCRICGNGKFYVWQICAEHKHYREEMELTQRDAPTSYAGGIPVPNDLAREKFGWPA